MITRLNNNTKYNTNIAVDAALYDITRDTNAGQLYDHCERGHIVHPSEGVAIPRNYQREYLIREGVRQSEA